MSPARLSGQYPFGFGGDDVNARAFFGTLRWWWLGLVVGLALVLGAAGQWFQNQRRQRVDLPPEWRTPLPTFLPNWTATATITPTPTIPPTPTLTPTWTPSPTPTLAPTATPTRAVLPLVAEGNLYCRAGPAPFYEAIAILQPGERALVVAMAPFEDTRYWLVALPDTRLCWVPDTPRFLEFEASAEALDQVAILPTPQPPEMAFTVTFAGQAECGNRHGWLFQITNYGTRAIESARITFAQGAGGERWDTYLTWWRDCQTRSGAPAIQPGRSMLVTVPDVGPGYGQTFTATVQACARDHLREPCATQTFSFRP